MRNSSDAQMQAFYDRFPAAFLAGQARRLSDLIIHQADEALRSAGSQVPSSCVSVMMMLHFHDRLTPADIAEALGKSHQLMTQRLNQLERLKLVKRRQSRTDQRKRPYALTAAGRRQISHLEEICSQVDRELSQWYAQRKRNLERELQLLERHLNQHPLGSESE